MNTICKAGLHLMQLYLLQQSGWRGLMLLLPQKLSDQWKERVERGGESMERIEAERAPVQSDVQATLHPHSRHTVFLRWHRSHPVYHHAAPFNHRHCDREHLTNRHLLDLPPGRCLLQVADGARRQTQEGGHPSLRGSQSIWTERMTACYCCFFFA